MPIASHMLQNLYALFSLKDSWFPTWQQATGICSTYPKLQDLKHSPNQIKTAKYVNYKVFSLTLVSFIIFHSPLILFVYKWKHSLNLEFSCPLDLMIGHVGCQL